MSFDKYFKINDLTLSNRITFIIGRVYKIVYGPYLSDGVTPDPDFNDPTDIGKVRFTIMNSAQFLDVLGDINPLAKPAWPHLNQLPLYGEYIYIIPGPGVDFNTDPKSQDLYYLPPFGLWSSPHHNAAPSLNTVAAYNDLQNGDVTATDTMQGSGTNTPSQDAWPFPLGNNFPEKPDVKALRPFVGDVTLEGRWGNSIRFGSSLKVNQSENNWAVSNKDGDPITIIRNGQAAQTDKRGWIPTVEDINNDKSSIYLTAGQQITIDDIAGFSLKSFGVNIGVTATTVKTLTQVPTSNDALSPQFQDNQVK